jgi:membrane-associated phospholipid phosphatase
MFWDIVSLIPVVILLALASIGLLRRNKRWLKISLGAAGLLLLTELIKYLSKPYLQDYPWLQRPKGAMNCGCFNNGGAAGGAPGFPSGHATIMSYLICILAFAYASKYTVGLWIIMIAILIPLVCYARLQKKCHNLIQVLTGVALGVTAAIYQRKSI